MEWNLASDSRAESECGSSELERAVEAMLFAADRSVRAGEMAGVYSDLRGCSVAPEDVVKAVHCLNEAYERSGRAFRINQWADGFRMATVAEYRPFITRLYTKETTRRLSRTLSETLAVIAYKQPVTRAQVDFVRGVDSDYAIKRLLELGLIDITGRSETVGRPLLYGTTVAFLDQFGLNSLDDLPGIREVEELLDDPGFSRERARWMLLKGEAEEPGLAEDKALENDRTLDNGERPGV